MRRCWSIVGVVLVAFSAALMPAASAQAAPRAGEITRVAENVPNYFIDHPDSQASSPDLNSNLHYALDPDTHRYFEFNDAGCGPTLKTNAAVYDLDTYKRVSAGCVEKLTPATKARNGTMLTHSTRTGVHGGGAAVALDPVDGYGRNHGLIFVPADVTQLDPTKPQQRFTEAPQIAVFDQVTLALIDIWDMPTATNPSIQGITWYGGSVTKPGDDLLVETYTTSAARGAATVYDIDVQATLRRAPGAGIVTRWDTTVQSCVQPIAVQMVTVAPYLSSIRDELYLACEIGYVPMMPGSSDAGAGTNGVPPRYGMVKVHLGPKHADGTPCPSAGRCPIGGTNGEQATPAPSPITGTLFDPGSDRIFGVYPSTTAGITVLTYNGETASFAGRLSVGAANDATNSSIGLDRRTGRLYGVSSDGMTVLDGRRTPVSAGRTYPAYAGAPVKRDITVMPPTAKHPYTRVLVPSSYDSGCRVVGRCPVFEVTVYADLLPVTVDPPLSAQDRFTYGGPLASRDTSKSFNASAGGYGLHADFVGSVDGVVGNFFQDHRTVEKLPIPFGTGDRDLLSGWVRDIALSTSGGANGAATALGDAPGSTDGELQAQTAPANGGVAWPFGTATCSTGEKPTDTKNQAGPVPAEAQAYATTDCGATSAPSAARASAYLGSARTPDVPSAPRISVGATETTSEVSAPAGANGTVATVTASVRDLHVDLGGGNAITIGEVSRSATSHANGRPHGAGASPGEPRIRDVTITVNGNPVVLCAGLCASYPAALDAINNAFPSLLKAVTPQADQTLAKGSPGGYVAAVQAEPAERYGDQVFNHMTVDEAAYLPALRLVLYYDGDSGSRVVLDLAGVKASTSMGITVLQTFVPPTPPQAVDVNVARDKAMPPPVLGFRPNGLPTSPSLPDQPRTPITVLASVLVRAFHGFDLLFRHPGEAASTVALLTLFAGPPLLITRRRAWHRDAVAETT